VATNLQVLTAPAVYADDAIMLAEAQRALRDVLATGQSYTIIGSRSFTQADIADLRKLVQMYERRVLTAAGFSGHNIANHDNDPGGDATVLP
jgi:hypothetical protein